MTTATTLMTLTHIGVLGAAVLGCAMASGDVAHGRDPTIQSPSAVGDDLLTPRPRRTGDALLASDLSAAPNLANATAYDVVLRLRPGFLQPRDPRTGIIASRGALPAVFLDGTYYGGVDVLRGIVASAVAEMQYVRPFDALYRYGPAYGAGVILLHLKRR